MHTLRRSYCALTRDTQAILGKLLTRCVGRKDVEAYP